MNQFSIQDGVLHAEGVALDRIAQEIGTPVYVYSRDRLARNARAFRDALAILPRVHLAFAVKSNPNVSVLRVLKREGFGADVVSAGEMHRALAAGIDAEDIVFSGVGKTSVELTEALEAGIGQFNLESEEEGIELARIAAASGKVAVAALRVNPDVEAGTHAKISTGKAENKFGVPYDLAEVMYARLSALDGLQMRGLAVHIGSQLSNLEPLRDAFTRMGAMMQRLRGQGFAVTHMDFGGGLGIPYREQDVFPSPADYATMVADVTRDWDVTLMFEPGRVIAGNAGVLVTSVVRVKRGISHPFVVVDAGMNDLARPALYDSWHDFTAVRPNGKRMTANIVGPICETSDTFAMARDIDEVADGDFAIFHTAGAYGATMANTYNSRALVPEVMVDGDRYAVVAQRIEPATILAAEPVPDWLLE